MPKYNPDHWRILNDALAKGRREAADIQDRANLEKYSAKTGAAFDALTASEKPSSATESLARAYLKEVFSHG